MQRIACFCARVIGCFCLLSGGAQAIQGNSPAGLVSGIVTKVSAPNRFNQTLVTIAPREVVLDRAWTGSEGAVSVSFTPTQIDAESVHFIFVVSQRKNGKAVALSEGHLEATIGQKTHLLAGHAPSGNLVDITVLIRDPRQAEAAPQPSRRKTRRNHDLYLPSVKQRRGVGSSTKI